MIDSTNPRQMADNIRELENRLNTLAASIIPVVANPTGDPTVQLAKVQIGDVVYGFEDITPAASTKRSSSK